MLQVTNVQLGHTTDNVNDGATFEKFFGKLSLAPVGNVQVTGRGDGSGCLKDVPTTDLTEDSQFGVMEDVDGEVVAAHRGNALLRHVVVVVGHRLVAWLVGNQLNATTATTQRVRQASLKLLTEESWERSRF